MSDSPAATRNRDEAAASPRLGALVGRIADVDTIVVPSTAQALLLENNLIKEHQPRFNVNLCDDKRYPWLAVTVQEPFPRILVPRQAAERAHDQAREQHPGPEAGDAAAEGLHQAVGGIGAQHVK